MIGTGNKGEIKYRGIHNIGIQDYPLKLTGRLFKADKETIFLCIYYEM